VRARVAAAGSWSIRRASRSGALAPIAATDLAWGKETDTVPCDKRGECLISARRGRSANVGAPNPRARVSPGCPMCTLRSFPFLGGPTAKGDR
jgi:hypothetical protein